MSNVNAVKRLEINDHSWVHIQIVANIALKLVRQLTKHGVEPAVVRDYGMSRDDAEVVVVLGALLHCVGMSIHREGHEDWSLFLADPKLHELLEGLYEEPELTVVIARGARRHHEPSRGREAAHPRGRNRPRRRRPRHGERPLAHPLRARPGLDPLALGRGDRGTWRSRTARTHPCSIEITMNNSSGVYQVDELLKAKLRGSGLEPYVEVVARIDTEAEKSLIPLYRLEL